MSCDICHGYPNCPVCGYEDDIDIICPECGGDMEINDSGRYKGKDWDNLKCADCGYEVVNEPDLDDYKD